MLSRFWDEDGIRVPSSSNPGAFRTLLVCRTQTFDQQCSDDQQGWTLPLQLRPPTRMFEAIPSRLEAIASRLEAIASRLEAIASRLEAIASRLEAIAIWLEAITIRLDAVPSRFIKGNWERQSPSCPMHQPSILPSCSLPVLLRIPCIW